MPNFEVEVKIAITAQSMAHAVEVLQRRIEGENHLRRNESYVTEINAKPEKKR